MQFFLFFFFVFTFNSFTIPHRVCKSKRFMQQTNSFFLPLNHNAYDDVPYKCPKGLNQSKPTYDLKCCMFLMQIIMYSPFCMYELLGFMMLNCFYIKKNLIFFLVLLVCCVNKNVNKNETMKNWWDIWRTKRKMNEFNFFLCFY